MWVCVMWVCVMWVCVCGAWCDLWVMFMRVQATLVDGPR